MALSLLDEEIYAVHTSTKTKAIGVAKEESYSLKKYGFDLIESEDKCYLPTTLLANLFYRCLSNDLLYNGMDFYLSSVVQSNALMCANQSYFASKGKFAALEGIDSVTYRICSFAKDGKGKLLVAPSPTEKGEEVKINAVIYSYEWEKKDDGIYVKNFVTGKDLEAGQTTTEPRGVSKIPLKDTYYGTKTHSKEMAAFSNNLLRFQFDNFYGLKEELKYEDFDPYAALKGLKEGLNSLDSVTYDETLAKLTCPDVDDGHTRYYPLGFGFFFV